MAEKDSLERYDTQTADARGGGGRALRGKLNVCVKTFASLRRSFQGLLNRWITNVARRFITFACPAELISRNSLQPRTDR